MEEIVKGGKTLARHIFPEDIREGLNFFSQEGEYIQAGAWNYPGGKELLAHIHKKVPRTAMRTYEVLYVISGSLQATVYDLDGAVAGEWEVKKGEVLILLESGHGYKILEDGTKVLEVKNGPYLGAEADRYRI